jgi:hypothetical protein
MLSSNKKPGIIGRLFSFIFRFLLTVLAIVGVAAAGVAGYFYFLSKDKGKLNINSIWEGNTPARPPVSTEVVLTKEGFTEITAQLVFSPSILKSSPSPNLRANPWVREVGVQEMTLSPHIFDEKNFDPKTLKFHFFAKINPSSTYWVDFSLCTINALNLPCDFRSVDYTARASIDVGAGVQKKIDLGNLYILKHYVRTATCDLSQPLYTLNVLPLKNFPLTPTAGKRFVFFASTFRPRANDLSGYVFESGPDGKKLIGLKRSAIQILYAKELELHPSGTQVTVPAVGFDPGSRYMGS